MRHTQCSSIKNGHENYDIQYIGERDQLCLGGGGGDRGGWSCPNIFSGAPALKKTRSAQPRRTIVSYIASVWKAKKSHPKMKPLARISSGFARILLVFCPNMAAWKILGGCCPPPPPPRPPPRTPMMTYRTDTIFCPHNQQYCWDPCGNYVVQILFFFVIKSIHVHV